MDNYTKRVVRFFFQSIAILRKESGGQRWNLICEDATALFFHKVPQMPYTHDQLWSLLFNAPGLQSSSYDNFEKVCSELHFESFLFVLLEGLTDPPKEWWTHQFK